MTSPEVLATTIAPRRVRVGGGYFATFTFDKSEFRCDWEPYVPRTLTAGQLMRYENKRDEFLIEALGLTGGRGLVVSRKNGKWAIEEVVAA